MQTRRIRLGYANSSTSECAAESSGFIPLLSCGRESGCRRRFIPGIELVKEWMSKSTVSAVPEVSA